MIAVLAVVDKTKPLADGFGNSGWRKSPYTHLAWRAGHLSEMAGGC
jgi:hypothetical protein